MLWNDDETLMGLFGLLAAGVALYWMIAGKPRRHAAIPASVEERIDHVVETLNEHVGKDWGSFGLEALEAELRGVLPAPLFSLLDVVHTVEEHAPQQLSSSTKRWWATHHVNQMSLG